MTSRVDALCFAAHDVTRLARVWASALGWELQERRDRTVLVPTDGTRFQIRFEPVPEEKAGKNRIHLDLTTTSTEDQVETVAKLLNVGGRRADVGQLGDEGHIVLADPEGNELGRSTASSPSARPQPTWAPGTRIGWSWPIPTATSSAS